VISEYRELKGNLLQAELKKYSLNEQVTALSDSVSTFTEMLDLESEIALADRKLKALRLSVLYPGGYRGANWLEWWNEDLNRMAVAVTHMKEENEGLERDIDLLDGRIACLEKRIALMIETESHVKREVIPPVRFNRRS
jgi:chromosome segregation ATPase